MGAAVGLTRRHEGVLRGWCALVAVVASRAYLAFAVTLVAAAFAPALIHWDSFVVRSGSMEPRISVGDVVIARPMSTGEPVAAGRVFVFEDQGSHQRLLVHRVVGRSADGGGWTTKGDANASADVAAAPRSAFHARARILVPYVGLPVAWSRDGRTGMLAGWALLTGAALGIVLLVRLPHRRGRGGPGEGGARRAPGSRARATAVVAISAALVAAPGVESASGAFTAHTRNAGNTWAIGNATLQRYNQAVLADSPHLYYLLDESSGASAQDYSGNGRTGGYAGVAGYRVPGALANNFGYGVNLGGGAGRVVSGGAALVDPRTFSVEVWFRTTSRAGGILFGFESGQGTASAFYDRQLTLRTDGRLAYGDWSGAQYRVVTSPSAYNDGSWHHLVLTSLPNGQSELVALYVDGNLVVSGPVTRTGAFSGWWRFGYGRTVLGGTGFPGSIDQAAVYRSALSTARVQAHYAAR